jgi:hypothetical protein
MRSPESPESRSNSNHGGRASFEVILDGRSMSAAGTSDSAPGEPTDDDEPLLPGLLEQLKHAGVDHAKADEFGTLLKQCNVGTKGGLLLFQESLPPLVNMMYDMTTPLGPLQAQGFLSTLRVRLNLSSLSVHFNNHIPFDAGCGCSTSSDVARCPAGGALKVIIIKGRELILMRIGCIRASGGVVRHIPVIPTTC